MPFALVDHADPRAFRDAVIHRLLESEAENCGLLGLIQRMADGGYTPVSADDLEHPLMLSIRENDRIDLVAVQTLKKVMMVSRGSADAMRCLADELARRNWTGEGVLGPSPQIQAMVQRYAQLGRRPARLHIRLRTFSVSSVTWPKPVPGSMRLCTAADRHLLARFVAEFISDIGEPSDDDPLAMADRLIEAHRIFFWEDERPVAMAASAGRTPNGIRINFVYTPPESRRRGYASNLVAQLTQRLLDEGRMFCFLNTDLANPTSNRIYQNLGYRPICDSERWAFETAGNE